MPRVFCYGDSLTWGSRPDGMGRHATGDLWPSVLATGLPGVEVEANGLRGRTTAHHQGSSPADTNGAGVLPVFLHSHAPIDLVVVMLGTNDIYFGFGRAQAINGLERIVEVIRHHPYRLPEDTPAPDILLVAPPPMVATDEPDVTQAMIDASQDLPSAVDFVARTKGVDWFDCSALARTSPVDGIHLDAENTRAIGRALIDPVRAILARRG